MAATAFSWGLFLLSQALTAIGLVLFILSFTTEASTFGMRGALIPLPVVFSILGLLIARREPSNVVGWLFLVNGVFAAILVFSDFYGIYGLVTRPGLFAATQIAWFQEWVWIPIFGILACVTPMYFPNGRLLSQRWLPVLGISVIAMLVAAIAVGIRPGPFDDFPTTMNPYGAGTSLDSLETVTFIAIAVLSWTAAAAALSLLLRLRRADEEQRQQMKWVLAAVAFAVCTIGFGATEEPVLETVAILGLLSVPAATGVSVLKYRLYDIDIVIKRSLVYVPLTAILAGVYIAGIGVGKALLAEVTGLGSESAVAFATLLVVSLLTPIKNSLQSAVDARFRDPPDASSQLARFDAQVRGVVEVLSPERLTRRCLEETARAIGAAAGAVYLNMNGTKEMTASFGAWHGPDGLRFPLAAGGGELGELWLRPSSDGKPVSDQERAAIERYTATVASAIALTMARQAPVPSAGTR